MRDGAPHRNCTCIACRLYDGAYGGEGKSRTSEGTGPDVLQTPCFGHLHTAPQDWSLRGDLHRPTPRRKGERSVLSYEGKRLEY